MKKITAGHWARPRHPSPIFFSEWDLVLAGEPVEINPALGHGFKVRERRGAGTGDGGMAEV